MLGIKMTIQGSPETLRGTTGEGRDIKVGRKNTGLCNDSPKYFACHVNTYIILLLNLFLVYIILNKFRL